MLVLVTGGSGFIGSRLIGRLIAAGHRVRSAGRRPARIVAASAQAPDRDSRIEHVAADFTRDHSTEDWLPRLEGVDVVVNAVGIIRERGPQSFDALHTRAPSALFAACERAGVRRVVQLSALGADEQAASRFHLSKRRADEFLLGLRVSAAVVQPSLVYGPGGGSARLFDTLASLPLAPLPAGGRQAIQPIHIDDLVDALMALIEAPATGGPTPNDADRSGPPGTGRVALVGPEPVSLRELIAQLRRSMGLGELHVLPIPAPLVSMSAVVVGRLPFGLFDAESWQMLQRGNTASPDATTALLGHPPRPIAGFVEREQAAPMRAQAMMNWLVPVLRLSIAAVWIVTGIVSLGLYPVEDSLALLARTGLHGTSALIALYGAAVLDLALGIAVLCWRSRWLWRMQIVLILVYTAIISWKLPEFWLHPYAPVLKNLPMLAVLWLLHEYDRRPWNT